MRLSLFKIAAVHVACLIGFAIPSVAQVQRGSIYGTVHDTTGAVLPGVVVQLTSEIGAPREGLSESRGVYRFPDLDPGPYTLKASLSGFAPLVRRDILVGVGTSVEIGIEMVLEAVPHLGYLHRCKDKIAENLAYYQYVGYTDRFDYLAALNNNHAWAMAVE